MRLIRFFFTLAVGGALWTGIVRASDVKVVANESVAASSISADDLKDVFLMTKSSLAGGHVEPVLEQDGPAHEAFLKEWLHKTAQSLQAYYRGQLFGGNASMPKIVASDAEVIAYVAKTKGAIGYVSAGAATAGVKVLVVK